jgi:hypothetical protein
LSALGTGPSSASLATPAAPATRSQGTPPSLIDCQVPESTEENGVRSSQSLAAPSACGSACHNPASCPAICAPTSHTPSTIAARSATTTAASAPRAGSAVARETASASARNAVARITAPNSSGSTPRNCQTMNASAAIATAMIKRRVYGSGLGFKRPTLSRSVGRRHRNDDHSAVGLRLTVQPAAAPALRR